MLPNALWGLAMPTIQSLMTRRVSEAEQGQLQGANNSVGAIAGVLSPLFFGAVYSISVGPEAWLPHPGAAFLIASLVLFGAATIAWRVALRARVATGVAPSVTAPFNVHTDCRARLHDSYRGRGRLWLPLARAQVGAKARHQRTDRA